MAGLADVGIDVRDAHTIVGTSAGSLVGAQITSGLSLEELFQRQVDPDLQTKESPPPIDFARWRADFIRARGESGDAIAVLKRFGALAQQVSPEAQETRRTMIAARLPLNTWPERDLLVVAVDVESGERHAFDRYGGVELIDAVMASAAVPGMGSGRNRRPYLYGWRRLFHRQRGSRGWVQRVNGYQRPPAE